MTWHGDLAYIFTTVMPSHDAEPPPGAFLGRNAPLGSSWGHLALLATQVEILVDFVLL